MFIFAREIKFQIFNRILKHHKEQVMLTHKYFESTPKHSLPQEDMQFLYQVV